LLLLDALEFRQLSSFACKKSENPLIDSTYFHPVRGERETALLRQILSDGLNNNTLVAAVHGQGAGLSRRLGFIALSVGKLEIDNKSFPAVLIDFLFVDHRYRGKTYGDDAMKLSEALISFAIDSAKQVSELAAVRYLILRPDGGKDNIDLVTFYESMGFEYMTAQHEWMYLKLT